MVGPGGLPAPDAPALVVARGAAAVEAVSAAVVAGDAVLEEDVRRALRGVAVAHLGQVALVGGAAAYRAGWKELKEEEESFSTIWEPFRELFAPFNEDLTIRYFGNMVISAIWAISAGQNRGP